MVPAGSDGLMTVLDWLAPTDQPFRKGVMLGFDARHTRGHVYRSILEAIALTMKHNVDAMCGELGIELDGIVVSGGGASSPLFMQIFADVFGLPASRSVDGRRRRTRRGDLRRRRGGPPSGHRGRSRGDGRRARDVHSRCRRAPTSTAAMNDTVYQAIRAATDPVLERSFPIFH